MEGVARSVVSGYVGVNGVARLFFAPDDGGAVVLEVEKITADTYANSTSYTGEEFIALDIYPKTGGTVKVTYGGLTKTITDTSGAESPNAQRVFFGTFNGVSDSVATPSSGELTIDGDCAGFASGVYQKGSKSTDVAYCSCITAVSEWADVAEITAYAFYNCSTLTLSELPSGITSIGNYAFFNCTGISVGEIPEGVTEIGAYAFFVGNEHNMPDTIILPSTITHIGALAFAYGLAQTFHCVAKKIIIRATEPPILGSDLVFGERGTDNNIDFNYQPDEIVVPAGSGATYKAAEYWSTYADRIVEET